MSVMTIRIPDAQHERLKVLAAKRGVSLNKLFETFAIQALAEFDVEQRFRTAAARGDRARGLDLLKRLDEAERPARNS